MRKGSKRSTTAADAEDDDTPKTSADDSETPRRTRHDGKRTTASADVPTAIPTAVAKKNNSSPPTTAADVEPTTGTASALATSQAQPATAEANLPNVSVSVVKLDPLPSRPNSPVRNFVLGVLGAFGFNPDPAPGHPNNPFLEALWAGYRRIESYFDNTAPDINSVQIIGTRYTADGKFAVDISVDVSDYDGDPIDTLTVSGAKGFIKNSDGTFTLLKDASYSGTETVVVGASDIDAGTHYHQGVGPFDFGKGHTRVATLAITIENTNLAPSIDSVTSAPGKNNSWVVSVGASDPEGNPVTVGLSAVDGAHVTVTGSGADDDPFTVTVTDDEWALAHPGAQISVTATASDGVRTSTPTTVAIGTVSNVVGVGYNYYGQIDIPALPAGLTYTKAAAGGYHTVLLRSDGAVFVFGNNDYGQLDLPILPSGTTYTQIAADYFHTALLGADGSVVFVGNSPYAMTIPAAPAGLTYTQISLGDYHVALLLSDGNYVDYFPSGIGSYYMPPLPANVVYTQVAAANGHTVLLRSDGQVVATGNNNQGQITVPDLPPGLTYTAVAASNEAHTVLLRSDGAAIAFGYNASGQNVIPALDPGVTYTAVAPSWHHTVLLRSDGSAVAVGEGGLGELDIPELPDGVSYTQIAAGIYHTVLLTAATIAT